MLPNVVVLVIAYITLTVVTMDNELSFSSPIFAGPKLLTESCNSLPFCFYNQLTTDLQWHGDDIISRLKFSNWLDLQFTFVLYVL